MKRRSFLAALAAIPLAGKLVQAEAPTPVATSATAELARLTPDQRRFEVIYDLDWDNPFGTIIGHRDGGPIYGTVFHVHTIRGVCQVPDLHKVQRVTLDNLKDRVTVEYRNGRILTLEPQPEPW